MITKAYCTFYDILSTQDKISTQMIQSPGMKPAIFNTSIGFHCLAHSASCFRIGTIIIIYLREKDKLESFRKYNEIKLHYN